MSKFFHALPAKIQMMAEVAQRKGKIPKATTSGLESYIGCSPSTLAQAKNKGRLSNELEDKIATALNIEKDSPRWLDLKKSDRHRTHAQNVYDGRDNVDDFWRYLCERNGISDYEYYKIVIEEPNLANDEVVLFTLEETSQPVVVNQPLALFFRVVVKPIIPQSGARFGFNRIRIKIRRPAMLNETEKSKIQFQKILGADGRSVSVRNAVLEAQGGKWTPEWVLGIDQAALEGEYRSIDEPMCEIIGAIVNEALEAEIAVHQHDGSLVNSETGEPLVEEDRNAVLEALCLKEVSGIRDSTGWISLGRQKITIISGDF
ncbi:hypothetical protein [Fulvimarina sp. MAC3]|uniref:hypothetical protein n=1 Tax=Fulvimarina sp. MAC3 TaxID=3148887 RepID=UPI0031FC2533